MFPVFSLIFPFVPGLGVVSATFMFAAPLLDVLQANQRGRLGDLNPTPWAFMLGNCCGWVFYSFVIQNLFVFFANGPGFLLAAWFNLQAIKLMYGDFRSQEERKSIVMALDEESSKFAQSNKPIDNTAGTSEISPPIEQPPQQSPVVAAIDYAKIIWEVAAQTKQAPIAHERLVLFIVTLWVATATVVAFGTSFSSHVRELIVGIVVNCNLIFFYGAPLSTIFQVLRTRSSATIHIPTMLLNTLNGLFWSAFGISVADYFIGVPNALGALLGLVQIVLCIIFPRRGGSEDHIDKLTQVKPATPSPSSEQDDTRGAENPPQSSSNNNDNNHDNTIVLKESSSVENQPEDHDAETGYGAIEVKPNGLLTLEIGNV